MSHSSESCSGTTARCPWPSPCVSDVWLRSLVPAHGSRSQSSGPATLPTYTDGRHPLGWPSLGGRSAYWRMEGPGTSRPATISRESTVWVSGRLAKYLLLRTRSDGKTSLDTEIVALKGHLSGFVWARCQSIDNIKHMPAPKPELL